MKLYIAEKPSLGRAIADVLTKPLRKMDGYITTGNGDCVSWCIGHLLEQAEPKAYDPAFQQWRQEHLPIIPEKWKLQAKPKTSKQLATLKKLIKDADEIVHAGDPDREGQLLVDQVIEFLLGKNKPPVMRCLINDLNPSAVLQALSKLRDNREFQPLSSSALARSRADWLYGINMTRAYTLQGRKVGFDGLLSVGRVQTPLLGLVVRRDEEIDKFEVKPYYEVEASIQNTHTDEANRFIAMWQPSEACEPYMDSDGHVLFKNLGENVIKRITNKNALVTEVSKKIKKLAPPLPYNLSSLQIEAGTRHSLSAQEVLDHCQSLYERHKLITYPRSDNRYLPKEHFKEAPRVLDAITANIHTIKNLIDKADTSIKSKAWNDDKVAAHHAIIPTMKKAGGQRLNSGEEKVYELIARQYICQFYVKHEFQDVQINLEIEGGTFISKSRETKIEGWKQVFLNEHSNKKKQNKNNIPISLRKGQTLYCYKANILEKETNPPKHFTDASLLSAMTGIARFVKNPDIRKILKETDGLGTEATRAGIIELLFRRQFFERKGKQILSTETGRALIKSLPDSATLPDMTANWESVLDAVANRKAKYNSFMDPLVTSLNELISQSQAHLPLELKGVKSTNNTSGKYKKKKRS
ncbi:MAG: DNA topoisomerase-3 [Candidatus Azotimanducaceae bacterium]